MEKTIDFDGEELGITYELVKGEEESDIPASSDQIIINNIEVDCFDRTSTYQSYEYERMEEIILDKITTEE